MKNNDYSELLKNPRWQKKRLTILERDDWFCQKCGDGENTLAVHHKYYLPGKKPWEYEDDCYITLCDDCHEIEKLNMGGCLKELNQVLKEKFLTEDIHTIMIGFRRLDLPHLPRVVASVLCWVLETSDIQNMLVRAYFRHLKKKHASG